MTAKIKDAKIAVWFSCGAASAVAAKKTLELYGKDNEIRIINNPIEEEHPDNRRFLKDVEAWLGQTIEIAVNPKYPNSSCKEVWAEYRQMYNKYNWSPCTYYLKKWARLNWELDNHADYLVLGFTYDEKKRAERFKIGERDNLLPVLVDEKIDKIQCFEILTQAKIKLPEMYSLGYPNANCIGCVKASSPTYWNLVRETHPDIFDERAKQSRELGAKLVRVNNERIFLDELDPKAKGRPLKNTLVECGIFCEEGIVDSEDSCE